MEQIELFDNFLDEQNFIDLQSIICGSNFPWYYNDDVAYGGEDIQLDNYQFTHCFYKQFVPHSDFYQFLFPVLKNLNICSLIRVKANLLTRTEKHIEHGLHIDIPYLKENQCSKTAILYMNTNNGYTKFEDKTKVESVANRLITFDSRLRHTGATCTNEKNRIVINFNYF